MVNFLAAGFKIPEKTADFPLLNRSSVSLHLNETIIGKVVHRLSGVDNKILSLSEGDVKARRHPLGQADPARGASVRRRK